MVNTCTVAICIPTYKRPEYLGALLDSISYIQCDEFQAVVIVADNDPKQSARRIVDERIRDYPLKITYLVERKRGIASVRNRLVREAASIGADFIHFLDDDQLVESDWLIHLVRTAKQYALDNVKAQDLPKYETDVPQWVIDSGYFEEVPRHTGRRVRNFGTNGVLIRTQAALQVPGPFDERFNLTGGSDGMFFAKFHSLGFISGGCRESIVYERVPASRATKSWMLERSYRAGVVKGIIIREIDRSVLSALKWVAISIAFGVFSVSAGLVLRISNNPRTIKHMARSKMCQGIISGLILGENAFGRPEYETTHGR